MQTESPVEQAATAGFWRRIGAFFIDSMLLGAIGLAMGWFFEDQLIGMGIWGRLLGFSIALAYFGTANSKVCGGQTLGKFLLRIKVVDAQGAALAVPKSYARFIPLGLPWFLNNAPFPASTMYSGWIYPVSILVFGVGLSMVYLYCFNRVSRQSLHDLLVGSFVVNSSDSRAVIQRAIRPLHLVICGAMVCAAGIAPYFLKDLANREFFKSLFKIQQSVSSPSWVLRANVILGKSLTSSFQKGQSTSNYLDITAYIEDKDIENAGRAKLLAKLALDADPAAATQTAIRVVLVYGYDIGIASLWKSQSYSKSPAQWASE